MAKEEMKAELNITRDQMIQLLNKGVGPIPTGSRLYRQTPFGKLRGYI
jgi:hypothetical protein